MAVSVDYLTLYLSPYLRGAPDRLRVPLSFALGYPGELLVASQQISDRKSVDIIVSTLANSGTRGRFLVEENYLIEQVAVDPDKIWQTGGSFEKNRQCFLALLRAGMPVRTDTLSSALQHANFIVAKGLINTQPVVVLTSANIAPGSIDSHYNWLIVIKNKAWADVLDNIFQKAWDGNFRDANALAMFQVGNHEIELAIGTSGQALELLIRQLESAKESITFAFFNISTSSNIVQLLINAQQRGVTVSGLVDGDQSNQRWDAVPILRDAGIDVRYYPGALTGASGRRMHYKFAVVDENIAYLGTANLSASALSSLELGIALRGCDDTITAFLKAEIERLTPLASKTAFTLSRI